MESPKGRFYLGVATQLFAWHLAIGRLSISVSRKRKGRKG